MAVKVPPKVAERLDKWVSTKLGLSGGAIAVLQSLGMEPNQAGICVTVVAVAFLVMVGLQEYQKAKSGGITLSELASALNRLKSEVAPPGSTGPQA